MSKQCKDCVHCEVCGVWRNAESLTQQMERAETLKCFKDKSRFVELPCEVGDDIYRIVHTKDKYGYYTDKLKIADWWEIVEIRILHDEIYFVDDSDNEFTIDDIGKTVFLTQEEVEKALKDRTKHIAKARKAGHVIDEYAAKIGLDEMHPDFNDACLFSDVRICCEVGCAESTTRNALLKVLNKNKEVKK